MRKLRPALLDLATCFTALTHSNALHDVVTHSLSLLDVVMPVPARYMRSQSLSLLDFVRLPRFVRTRLLPPGLLDLVRPFTARYFADTFQLFLRCCYAGQARSNESPFPAYWASAS